MKPILSIVGVAAAGFLLASPMVQAAEGEKPRRAAVLEKFDTNGDGKLDEAERQAAKAAWQERKGQKGDHAQRRAAMLKRFDTDGDGQLSEAEKAAAKAAHAERRAQKGEKGDKGDRQGKGKGHPGKHLQEHAPELFAQLDTNSDGRLSREEAEAGKEQLKAHRAAKRAEHMQRFQEKHPEAFARADSNGDGTLSQDEMKAVHAARVEKLKTEKPELFAKLDKNNDGTLDRREMHRARQHHRNKGNKGRKAQKQDG